MSHRSLARLLAPLALIAACATVYLVVRAGLADKAGSPAATPTTVSSQSGAKRPKKAKRSKNGSSRTYTVKSGDVLGRIATRTGVSVDDLLKANKLNAADPLRVGQKLKLAP